MHQIVANLMQKIPLDATTERDLLHVFGAKLLRLAQVTIQKIPTFNEGLHTRTAICRDFFPLTTRYRSTKRLRKLPLRTQAGLICRPLRALPVVGRYQLAKRHLSIRRRGLLH